MKTITNVSNKQVCESSFCKEVVFVCFFQKERIVVVVTVSIQWSKGAIVASRRRWCRFSFSEKGKAVCPEDQQGESASEEANERFLNALVPDVSTAEIPESATNIFGVSKSDREEKAKRAARKTRLYKTQARTQQGRRCSSANRKMERPVKLLLRLQGRSRRRRTQTRKEGKKATKPQVKGRQRGENEEAEEED